MAEERAQRRLAAILAADVVGYSRLMVPAVKSVFEMDLSGSGLPTGKAEQEVCLPQRRAKPTSARPGLQPLTQPWTKLQ